MSKKKVLLFATLTLFLLVALAALSREDASAPPFISYTVDLRNSELKLYWKDDKNQRFRSLQGLKSWLGARGQPLVFAMNAGMFNPAYSPQGLFIQDGATITRLDTTAGTGNFYLKPNGVFYTMTDHTARICKTADFRNDGWVSYATQSGPMLVIDGKIHPAFKPGSTNVQIRNGVGILPGNRVFFAMSTRPVSFYDFAEYFREAGCRNALYLDGYVSRTYAPSQNWTQLDGDFGVIIGVTAH
jgi:uncharacterized protein YigE (DUF2233 family)